MIIRKPYPFTPIQSFENPLACPCYSQIKRVHECFNDFSVSHAKAKEKEN
jgi:hypothetical protein